MKRNRDELIRDYQPEETNQVKTEQLLSTGLREDEVQEISEYEEDGWQYVDDDY
ncbi:hypothetical protein JMA_18320 [Jeotgalibacillus malaysiensis]|uniref:Uncharacterized protein n=1 Tax=Jeotgalibacillus malaysiensis TaxID=1508404 RepID=A0A0B5ASZ1_9BACL|nr:hypothetical protein [Jeotgalibacillus malaysiensis]AJD91149.1 hypothetical protein JMA_18320 [Jeotgalibacillus malaysiensis]